jgi:hypothetical protein
MFSPYVAIDPAALLLPTDAYLRYVEKVHPHEPVLNGLAEATRTVSEKEATTVRARIQSFKAYIETIEKALPKAGSARA